MLKPWWSFFKLAFDLYIMNIPNIVYHKGKEDVVK